MSNLNVTATTSNTYSGITWTGNTGGYASNVPFIQAWCSIYNQHYSIGSSHICSPTLQQTVLCVNCGQSYASGTFHVCSTLVGTGTSYPWNTWTTGTWNHVAPPILKNVKEITTDIELEYWLENLVSADLKLPAKFGDCFLKVGDKYSPLYPLLIYGTEGDSITPSFYIVNEISGKVFQGDLVLLQSIKLAKIEDNLTLLQLSERTRNYFKEDK